MMKINPSISVAVILILACSLLSACQNGKPTKDNSVDYKDARDIPVLKVPVLKIPTRK